LTGQQTLSKVHFTLINESDRTEKPQRTYMSQPNQKHKNLGFIDHVDDEFIFGWAQEMEQRSPARISAFYQGVLNNTFLADQYRHDLEKAGIGQGCHAFQIPLPCRVDTFEPKLLEMRFQDGTPLKRSVQFLAWPLVLDDFDPLSSRVTRIFHLEFTSRCNLRCIYCAVSHPTYKGQDLEMEDFDTMVAMLKKRRVNSLVVNGHGETTFVIGWHHRILALAAAGFSLSIITNLARLLEPDELAAMARISGIQVSIDTHRPEVLRRVRRRVELRNILDNMAGIASTAVECGLPIPTFMWSCVVTDQVAGDLVDYVRFGLSHGVRQFTLCNLTKYDDIDGVENVKHVTTLPSEELERFAASLEEARAIIAGVGGSLEIQAGLTDSVQEELRKRRI
jgi:uncharacterized radical SAM superfamily Fe-S cluster-containing enzyme